MLEPTLKSQLQSYLERVTQPFDIVASLDDGAKSAELWELLQEIAGLTDKISLRSDGTDSRVPSFTINRKQGDVSLRFAGIPLGHEFTSLVLALLQVGGHPPRVTAEVIDQIRHIEGEFRFETYYSLSCQNCPDVVQALNLMTVLNPGIHHVAIDGALFQAEVDERQVMSVPSVYLNGKLFASGRMGVEEILAKIDTGAAFREAEKISAREPFDVLVVGGGPAGAAGAIYAARKGIRTGVAAERFGGQVLDTMGIENLISVAETEGPKLARALEENVQQPARGAAAAAEAWTAAVLRPPLPATAVRHSGPSVPSAPGGPPRVVADAHAPPAGSSSATPGAWPCRVPAPTPARFGPRSRSRADRGRTGWKAD